MLPIRSIIIDDERYACERLKNLLTPFSQIKIIDYYTDSRSGFNAIIKYKPELLFIDVELENNISAFDIIDQLEENLCRPNIILVTAHPHYSIRAIKNRVFDYLIKPVDIDELKETMDRFFKHVLITPVIIAEKFNMLSQRELNVLNHVLEGKSSKEIAELLCISINTINTHRRNILRKTRTNSVVELMRLNGRRNV